MRMWKVRGIGLLAIVRDFLINLVPVKSLPVNLVAKFYGFLPTFIFLTHPRGRDDIYGIAPILRPISRVIPERILFWLISRCPCYVVAYVTSREHLRGVVISTTYLPNVLFSSRKNTLQTLRKIFAFIKKITQGKIYVGLAAWWPIVTNSGVACHNLLDANDRIIITNGHCATAASIYLTLQKLSKLIELPLSELDISIIGVGRMGGTIARILSGKVRSLGLVDTNPVRLQVLSEQIGEANRGTRVERFVVSGDSFSSEIRGILVRYHLGVCTTSNLTYLMNTPELLENCIVLDDARPEAFPRIADLSRRAIVLEGGVMRIRGIRLSYDFGFGHKDNIFGCLAEAFMLALDKGQSLRQTIGEVDLANFERMLKFCQKHDIAEGDFKSGEKFITDELIRNVFLSILRKGPPTASNVFGGVGVT